MGWQEDARAETDEAVETRAPATGRWHRRRRRGSDHPASDLAIALMKHGLQKGALNGSEPVDALSNHCWVDARSSSYRGG
ncbi:MAG: hypothetical protein CM15mP77_1840 [Synechococcus sp.]|nr:MAG: hypothetical protein CM15mP77_1840 [Synechococcus sp.]